MLKDHTMHSSRSCPKAVAWLPPVVRTNQIFAKFWKRSVYSSLHLGFVRPLDSQLTLKPILGLKKKHLQVPL